MRNLKVLLIGSFFATGILIFPLQADAQGSNVTTDSAYLKFANMKDFTKKGSWMTGGTLSLKFKNSTDKNELIRYVEDNRTYDFAVRVDGAYAFADLNFAGLALLYGQAGRSGVFQNSDGQTYTEDLFGTGYSFTPFLKNLTPIDKKGRFNIITQIEFSNRIDQGITQIILNEELTRKQSLKYTGSLGVRPGISVFVLQNVAFETTLNVAGVKYSYERIRVTDLPDAKSETASIDFKIDILQLNIGIFIYIQPKK
ncbi:MAG: hypothetical protein MUC78_02535 [Bacteroidales bacterium]|jgi:hypothetical protein|nr:hypothetical protein [Bacteroidales bacterium]